MAAYLCSIHLFIYLVNIDSTPAEGELWPQVCRCRQRRMSVVPPVGPATWSKVTAIEARF